MMCQTDLRPEAGPAHRRDRALRRLAARFARDRRGVSAIEFAFLLPLLALLYIGGNEVGQAVSAYRKVSLTAGVVGDLVAQAASVTNADVTNILAVSTSVMLPFSASSASIVAAVAYYDTPSNTMKIRWVKTSGAAPAETWTAGGTVPASVSIPSSLKVAGQDVVIAKVNYTYQSMFTNFMQDIWGTTSIPLADVAFLRPRVSSTIPLN